MGNPPYGIIIGVFVLITEQPESINNLKQSVHENVQNLDTFNID